MESGDKGDSTRRYGERCAKRLRGAPRENNEGIHEHGSGHRRFGFIGGHCILQLLAAGHQVKTTVRNLKREGDVRAMLRRAAPTRAIASAFFAADLESDAGWKEAARAATTFCMWRRPFRPGFPSTKTS